MTETPRSDEHEPRVRRGVPARRSPRTPDPGAPPTAAPSPRLPRGSDGRVRAIIDALSPTVDAGRFPAKALAGRAVPVEAHCFADGHDRLRVVLRWGRVPDAGDGELAGGTDAERGATSGAESVRASDAERGITGDAERGSTHTAERKSAGGERRGISDPLAEAPEEEVEMEARANDVWCATFTPSRPGLYRFTAIAWVDHFESWRDELERRLELEDVRLALQVGCALISRIAARAAGEERRTLAAWAGELAQAARSHDPAVDAASLKALALDPARARLARRYADRRFCAMRVHEIIVDRPRAGFSAWYELFPRSAADEPGRHGTFKDVEARLPYVAGMGFDVLYLPPIQPIGEVHRKGANNALEAAPGDVGSPWAIGSTEGGHCSIHPALGTLEEFRALIARARTFELEIALDLAFQCAPDHPYVREHPEWFRHRPDGSVQYAENPPKKYQDIYPFDFECDDWQALWSELGRIVEFWIAQGVRIFRVDNPHTKPFAFWEWLIGDVRRRHPDVLFLAEAFTRPKPMQRLAKLGFTQSYTYFTWRNTRRELTEYFTELARGPARCYFRPNVWPNTPDILHETLQDGRRATFATRLVLAATLSPNYGIYGPAFELMESTPREPGSEEYRDSEKYQLRHWSLERPDSLRSLITRMNRIRREQPALQAEGSLEFVPAGNEQMIAYIKRDAAGTSVLIVVNLDPMNAQSGWIELDLQALGLEAARPYQAHDLLSGQRFNWHGARNLVHLDPQRIPAHVLRLRRFQRSEHDFDYYQ